MKKFIIETLLSGKTDEIDLEFAGDYLPDLGIGDNESSIHHFQIETSHRLLLGKRQNK